MSINYLLCLAVLGSGSLVTSQALESGCPEIGAVERSELSKYVQAKYHLRSAPTVAIQDAEADCYYKLRFTDRNGFNLALLLGPDHHYLFTMAFDVRIDPAAEEQAQSERRMVALVKGAKPIEGSDAAVVKVVVYSDFQCPYCARFWSLLKEFRGSQTVAKAALYYRSFPLEGAHPWARTASTIAVCALEQTGTEHFLDLADFFFEEQPRLNSKTFKDMTMARLRRQPGFDDDRYNQCMSSGRPEEQIAGDVESAQLVDVNAVPTIFINGHKIEGVPSPEQFKTILNQAIAAASATPVVKPSPPSP